MSKCKTSSKHINSSSDKAQSMDKITISHTKLNHSDKITIDKMKHVREVASWFNIYNRHIDKMVNKHLYNIKEYCCVGEYDMDIDKICLFSDGLEYFMEVNHSTVEEQILRVISHEIMHRILFYEHGEHTTRAFDNIAEKLKAYGMW